MEASIKKWKTDRVYKQDGVIFCIAEFENTIRIMGELETGLKIPTIGQDLDFIKCDYTNKEKFFFRLK